MSDDDNIGFLNLTIHNFGPIKECSIDIRPLSVFIGPSNTGKSYLAILIYALHKGFANWSRNPIRLRSSSSYFKRGSGVTSKKKFEELVSSFQKSILEAEARIEYEDDVNIRLTLYKPFMDLVKSTIVDQEQEIVTEIERCFGSSLKEMVRYRSKGESSIRMEIANQISENPLVIYYELRKRKIITELPEEITIDIADRESFLEMRRSVFISPDYNDHHITFDHEINFLAEISDLVDSLRSEFLGKLLNPMFYLPADRTGIMHAHSLVVSSLIESASMRGLRRGFDTPLLSGVHADFLEKLIVKKQSIFGTREGSRRKSRIADELEQTLLGGEILKRRSEITDYPEYTYLPDMWKRELSLINSSSMVSELAPVILYLKEHVNPSNFLIVEEPESHLHPAKQVLFTRILAKLVNTGVFVIVITHSEWLVEELANIVQRHQVLKPFRNSKFSELPDLSENKLGVWLFENQRNVMNGSVVNEILINESGLYPTGYDRVAEKLHNDWAWISNEVGGERE